MKRKVWKYCFLFLTILASGRFIFQHVYDFISINRSSGSDILVVEGWLPDEALEKAREEFLQNKYKLILTTGFPYYEGVLMGSSGRDGIQDWQQSENTFQWIFTPLEFLSGEQNQGANFLISSCTLIPSGWETFIPPGIRNNIHCTVKLDFHSWN